MRTLELLEVEAADRIQTHEHDPLIRRWDHRIELQADGPNRTRYRDTVEIGAGVPAGRRAGTPILRQERSGHVSAESAVPESIDAYIAAFPDDVQAVLEQIRAAIRDAAPGATETISYQIPTFMLEGHPLVYFAGFKKHLSVYPAPVENAEFREAMASYASGRGTARFRLDLPIPFDLVTRIVEFRIAEVRARAAARRKKKT